MQRLVTFIAALALFELSTGIVFAHDSEPKPASASASPASLGDLPSVNSLPDCWARR